ncbi:MAG: CocE/NonD family hydrolase [Streptosporangiaceae bacterium]|nr:CocE/NonD family hydrolase [Streptosporangiaceae bacterium]
MKLFRGRRRRQAAGAALAVAAGILFWSATTAGDAAVRASQQRITVVDGPHDDQRVPIDTTFFRPGGGGRAPAVLLAHGFGGSKDEVKDEAMDLARHGYAVLTWSARGFGHSGGEIALNSPDYEVKDVRQLIDWLARRPDVQMDGPGNPRVGIAGQSYGGAIALLAAAYDARIDAIAPQITWYDLAGALFPDASAKGPENGVFKKLWAGIFFTSGSPGGSPSTACGRFLPSLCAMYEKVAESGRPTAEAITTLRRSSPSSVAGRIKVPTLLVQGQADSLFPLDQADANARAITGAPVKVVWYQGGHDGGEPETDRLRELERGWFDRFLKPGTADAANFTVTRAGGIDSSTQRPAITAASAGRYPGLMGDHSQAVPLTGPAQTVHNPAGGAPAAISALPGLGALTGVGSFFGGGLGTDTPGQQAVFDSSSLGAPVQLSGTGRVRIHVSGPATLFAKIYDVGPGGQATPARRLAAPLRVAGAAGGDAEVSLPGMDYRFDRGHRIRLVLATTDMGFASPSKPAVYQVSVTSVLTVPLDLGLRTPSAPLPWWTWGLPLLALGAAVVVLATGRRGGQRDSGGPAAGDRPPLEITGLTKRYKNGQLAVDNLSLRVERGQVCGLLGPNGAGKTTTLRMLMGLIHPDAGEIRIFGHRVTPGAPALSRLGSFVEGPGFLPHLSGRDNLELYWRATGRPARDAHLNETLEIAALGEALSRPVRTYSHGMRQRLAIAQAMLGLPELLVLDEPTNGLDPPQIAAMREVLVRYAAEGRTVIVSSHMLAEVEQTCTDVVVMHRGLRIAAGPVTEIAGHDGAIVVGTPDTGRALTVLHSLDGIAGAEPYDPGVLVRLNGSTPARVVAALVTGGVEVDRVHPHRRLEDAFLTLIGRGGENE